MKYIFLDIDGVVNTFWDKKLILDTFEKEKLEKLVSLSKEFNAKVIITSERRFVSRERDKIENIFKQYFLLVDYISLYRTHKTKSEEILEYVKQHFCTSYVILDSKDLGYTTNNELSKHFVDTNKQGFKEEEYILAKGILSK